MTNWIFTTILTLSYLFSTAQYYPFPQSDAIWEGSFIGFVGFPQKEIYVLCGDTIFENSPLPYDKIYRVSLDSMGNVIDQSFIAGTIEEDVVHMVWANDGSGPGPYILYDFNLEAGDHFITEHSDTLWVDSIGYTNVNGEMRRTTYFEHHPDLLQEFWIEGIGSNFNVLNRGIDLLNTADYSPYLECFRKNNELLINLYPGESVCTFTYQAGPECTISTSTQNLMRPSISLEVYPNPAQGYVHLKLKGVEIFPLNGKLYDIFGKTALQISPIVANQVTIPLNNLPPGMYFLQINDPATQTYIATKKLLIQD